MTEHVFDENFKSDLLDSLNKCVLQLEFVKQNGERRVMKATLLPRYLPQRLPIDPAPLPARPKAKEIVTVWDVDKDNWRSINLAKTAIIATRLTDF